MNFPSVSSSTMAPSSIHGTGAQNFPNALCSECSEASGMALGPSLASAILACALLNPPGKPVLVAGSGGCMWFELPIRSGNSALPQNTCTFNRLGVKVRLMRQHCVHHQ
jgi:hypothetical protein